MRSRKLRLVKETLSVLDTGELRSVVGGSELRCLLESRYSYTYCADCANDLSFEFCPTLPVEQCV